MTRSLFAHLALKFGSHPENLATEALAYISQAPAANAELVALLQRHAAALPETLYWSTQESDGEGGRPDLVGKDARGNRVVLIEAKFWAGLTSNQPLGYLGQLVEGGVLVFLVPDARRHLVWNEIGRRLTERSSGASPVLASWPPLPAEGWAQVGNKRIAMLTWSALCATLQRACEVKGDVVTARSVAELAGLCTRMETEGYVPVTHDELTSRVYRRVGEFGKMVDLIVERLKAEGLADTSKLRSVAANGRYGRYLRLRGVCCQIMCDLWKWTTYASTPLWITVYGRTFEPPSAPEALEVLAPLQHESPPRMFKALDGFPTVALFVPAGEEQDAVIAAVLDQLRALAERMACLASTVGIPSSPPPGDDVDAMETESEEVGA